ncbi:hypothetical protein DOMOVOI_05090 [Brevundimonas phage vB_BpoS-Domovoi]|uniref:Uncharacterized protein n=1 Tax=Brevundimonas phage vB_BpoS-Domovoi TaxID=2948598 RepID=A0A9E7MRV2_9CAUD|nr:hypothetical protein DOMOVOI_05090 [Brevundimonas phage vB_BpoS-Domovoi]
MAIQNKHSATPNARPHLLPGQVGHNTADRRLHLRVDGRPESIHLPSAASGVAPATGPQSAPLSRKAGVLTWDPDLAPLAVVDGVVAVDAPPGGFAVPGLAFDGAPEEADLPAETILFETFHVASDTIRLTEAGVWLSAGAGAVRIGLYDSADHLVFSHIEEAPLNGVMLRLALNTRLRRGAYRAYLWTQEARTVRRINGWRLGQGFDAYGAGGEPRFIHGHRATGDFLNGVFLNDFVTPLEPEYAEAPGEKKAVWFNWALD